MSSLQVRTILIAALVLLFAFISGSNFFSKEERVESSLLVDDGLRLGLDLQGGIHWVVGVELDVAIKRELEYQRDSMIDFLQKDGVAPTLTRVDQAKLTFGAASDEDARKIRDLADESGILVEEGSSGNEITYALTDEWTNEIHERTMMQVLEVLRRRIDDPVRGIPDSVVTRQGKDRVLVQIPGGQIDRGRARQLLKSTGFLEFKIVLASAGTVKSLEERFPDGLPEGQIIATERDPETDAVVEAYLVREAADLTGDYLVDARVGFDQQQRSLVNFTFSSEGGDKFGELTGENLQKRLAIVLDENVYSAPTIQSRITMRGQISGRFTPQEAADLAVVLRAGSLSVPVVIEEERTVGPALGQDSIDRGTRAAMLGLLLIMVFVMIYYRVSGAYAGVALTVNLVLLIGLMSLFEATLTLPGIAGLVLTVGMAVDANVIIFERIREELRVGKTVRAAVATGFEKARWTVLDANITTLVTALLLFEFGTGPIKGFAVTLSIGILTSVFAALVVTRLLFEIYPGTRNTGELSI
ncbi:MAG: protein translocase subunit SecD [Myxococcota bacterium]|jgi:preprotein translocase subunit SecD|nr:protein translocase subunit SecD [Myxococcota bacterium]